jgi:hypothetical protein
MRPPFGGLARAPARALALSYSVIDSAISSPPEILDERRGSDSFVVMSSYRHIVIFKFKDGAPADKVRGVVEAFKALPGKLPAIKAFEWGTNVSPEGLDQGFTHIFTLTFASKEALEKQYLHEPAHQEFVALLPDILEKALVVDYVGQ